MVRGITVRSSEMSITHLSSSHVDMPVLTVFTQYEFYKALFAKLNWPIKFDDVTRKAIAVTMPSGEILRLICNGYDGNVSVASMVTIYKDITDITTGTIEVGSSNNVTDVGYGRYTTNALTNNFWQVGRSATTAVTDIPIHWDFITDGTSIWFICNLNYYPSPNIIANQYHVNGYARINDMHDPDRTNMALLSRGCWGMSTTMYVSQASGSNYGFNYPWTYIVNGHNDVKRPVANIGLRNSYTTKSILVKYDGMLPRIDGGTDAQFVSIATDTGISGNYPYYTNQGGNLELREYMLKTNRGVIGKIDHLKFCLNRRPLPHRTEFQYGGKKHALFYAGQYGQIVLDMEGPW